MFFLKFPKFPEISRKVPGNLPQQEREARYIWWSFSAILGTLGCLFGPLGCLLESFWGVLGLVLGHLRLFWARFWALRVAFWNPLTLYAHQLVNASTLQPVARQHLKTRAGGLRAERLNNTRTSSETCREISYNNTRTSSEMCRER